MNECLIPITNKLQCLFSSVALIVFNIMSISIITKVNKLLHQSTDENSK